MYRVNVHDEDRLAGWFDRDAAVGFQEATDWDGSNWISVNTRSQWKHQKLFRTAGGRWVLNSWSQWQGTLPRWEFVDADRARLWLLNNEYHDTAVEQYFGPVEAECEI